jgi:hypothetical protein
LARKTSSAGGYVATLETTDTELIVEIEGADKLWALRSRLTIPLSHVAGAKPAQHEAREWLHGLRVGGTHIPGVISAGTFISHGERVFWDVHTPENAIAIQLRDERFGHLVIEVSDPDEAIATIEGAASKPA